MPQQPLYSIYLGRARQPYDRRRRRRLLAARSYRGRSGTSKRVSNIHESDRTHPLGYTQYASGGERDDASGVHDGHLRDGALRRVWDGYVIDERALANRRTGNLEFHLHL